MGESRKISFHALVGGQPKPGRRPASKIRKARGAGNALHVIQRHARTVAGADQRADASASDTINRNAGVRQRAKHTDVRDPTRKAARQR